MAVLLVDGFNATLGNEGLPKLSTVGTTKSEH
jgi:hypothetical protein